MSGFEDPEHDIPHTVNIVRDHHNFSPPPEGPQDYQADMLPPLSCPRLADRPREVRQASCLLLSLLLLSAAIAVLIWLSGWVEGDFEMTSVYSTRELRPVPKLLIQMVKDPASLSVVYHRGNGEGRGGEGSHPVTTTEQPLTLLVLVDSSAHIHSSEMRRAVRETWMKCPSVGVRATVIFTVAGKGLSNDKLMQLKAESQKHKDMAIFPESSVLPESEHLLYQLGWAEGTFSYRYLLRTKDRYYVRLEEIIDELPQTEPQTNLYWGYFEGNRWAKQRWRGKHAEPDWFLCSKFIRYAHSGGYIIAQSLVRRVVKSADYLQLYQNEDIALATWLVPYGDVTWKHDIRFDTDPGQSRGCQNSFLIFPCNNRGDMLRRHQRLADSGLVCRKEHHLLHPHTFDFSVLPAQCCPAL